MCKCVLQDRGELTLKLGNGQAGENLHCIFWQHFSEALISDPTKITHKPFCNACELLARFVTPPNGKLNAWDLSLYISKKISVSEYQDEKGNLITNRADPLQFLKYWSSYLFFLFLNRSTEKWKYNKLLLTSAILALRVRYHKDYINTLIFHFKELTNVSCEAQEDSWRQKTQWSHLWTAKNLTVQSGGPCGRWSG